MKFKWLATVGKFLWKWAPGVVEAALRIKAQKEAEKAAEDAAQTPPAGIEG